MRYLVIFKNGYQINIKASHWLEFVELINIEVSRNGQPDLIYFLGR